MEPLHEGRVETSARPRARPRVKTAGFPDLPLNLAEFYAADLTAAQRGVHVSLIVHLWFHGELPRDAKARAEIGRVHVRTWGGMEAAIAPHFDIDDEGRWRHYDLEEAREAQMATRAKRAAANSENAARRWAKLPSGDAKEDAIGNANGIANDHDTASRRGATRTPSGIATPSAAQGLSDRQDSLQIEEKIEESDAQTDAQRSASAVETPLGTANGTAIGDADQEHFRRDENAIGIATSGAHGPGRGDAKGISISDAKQPTDGKIKEALSSVRGRFGPAIPQGLLTKSGVALIRSFIADGCDFFRDIVPAYELKLGGAPAPLKSLKAEWIVEVMHANRDARLSADQSAAAAQARRTAQQPDLSKPEDREYHAALIALVGQEKYEAWFISIRVVGLKDCTYRLSVEAPYLKEHLPAKFGAQLLAAARTLSDDVRQIEIEVRCKAPCDEETARSGPGP